jgi:hypothetical protein
MEAIIAIFIAFLAISSAALTYSLLKADIYSTQETGTRHLDRAQEKPVVKVEDKEKGSWRIKEEGEER